MSKHRITAIFAFFTAAMLLAGCAKKEAQPVDAVLEEASIKDTVTEADPETAIEEIYATLPDAQVEELSTTLFYEMFPEISERAATFYGRISNPSDGLADVVIVEPRGEDSIEEEDSGDDERSKRSGDSSDRSNRDAVWDELRRYQERRMAEFENYDILDAFSISSNAVVFNQGDYVILLMLPDNEAARDIIDQYIPL